MEWQTPEVAAPVAIAETETPWYTFDHHVELAEAKELIDRHKRQNTTGRTSVISSRVPLDQMLAQEGCVGIRMYFAMNPDGMPTLVLVGVDENFNDLDQGVIADRFLPCPTFCSMDSLLDR